MREDKKQRRLCNNQPANKKEDKEVATRRTTADKRREMTRGGSVGATTNWQTRDEGSKEEGKDGKGNGNATAMAAMDSATVTAMDGNDGNGQRDGGTLLRPPSQHKQQLTCDRGAR